MLYFMVYFQCHICDGKIAATEEPITIACDHHFCRSCWEMYVHSHLTVIEKGIWPVKKLICWWWQFEWNFAHLIAVVVTTTLRRQRE